MKSNQASETQHASGYWLSMANSYDSRWSLRRHHGIDILVGDDEHAG